MLKTRPLDARRFALMALDHIERRAKRIRRRRKELRMTQEDVAERMQEIHAERHPDEPPDQTRGQMVSDWERSVNEPRARKLELLAAALDWTVGDLSADDTEESPTPDVMSELAPPASQILRHVQENSESLAELQSAISVLQDEIRRLGRQLPGQDEEVSGQ